MQGMLTGAIAIGWLLAGLFFFRFWRRTRDRFFLWFALSFWLEACNRVADAYAAHLMSITDLIHSRVDRRAQQFADAFRFRKDKE